MSTIYLMVKTHQKTRLKYLCKTKRNPLTYNGSGVDWETHLRIHGIEHETEIVRECHSHEELSYWGRFYSRLWNVVGAMDDFGNKIWANRIPETGGGHGGIPGRKRGPSIAKSNSDRWKDKEWASQTSSNISAGKSTPDKVEKTRKQMVEMNESGYLNKKRQEKLKDPEWVKKEKERIKIKAEKQKRPVIINGIEFPGIKDAAKYLNIEKSSIRWRIKSKNPLFTEWQYKSIEK